MPEEIMKTSHEWMTDLKQISNVIAFDFAGWETNLKYSFHKEKISKIEFCRRMKNSHILCEKY